MFFVKENNKNNGNPKLSMLNGETLCQSKSNELKDRKYIKFREEIDVFQTPPSERKTEQFN